MKICKTISELDDWRNAASDRIAFVPTMGALHAGHLSLVELAKAHAEHVVVSIYVNPTQFAPHEDFDAYPRDLDADFEMLKAAGVDVVFTPDTNDIYPDGPRVSVKAGAAAAGLESDFRPHFFDGVCSVVYRLFGIVHPDIAVFGEKDYQQLMVIRDMVETHDLGIEIIGGPIIRDEYGLALSSRNAYLSAEELEIARKLNTSLRGALATRQSSTQNTHQEMDCFASLAMTDELLNIGFTKVDYIEERWGRILAAAWIGKTRLIDNIELSRGDP